MKAENSFTIHKQKNSDFNYIILLSFYNIFQIGFLTNITLLDNLSKHLCFLMSVYKNKIIIH